MAIQYQPAQSFPQNNEDSFPVGQEIILIFSEATDIKRIKESVAVYGPDFDITSGPDNALWLDKSTAENPFFLASPGFKGFVDFDVRQYLIDSTATVNPLENQIQLNKNTSQPVAIVITPKNVLKENTAYSTFIVGKNVDNLDSLPVVFRSISKDRALTARTIFDPYSIDGSNNEVEQTSRIKSYGSYVPKNDETSSTVNIKIITAGEGSSAKYKWWFSDENEPQPANDNYNSRVSRCVQRWRKLDRGVLVRFTLSSYVLNETFQIRCFERESLETSYGLDFQTGTTSVYDYPKNVSSSPIGVGNLVIPSAIPSEVQEKLKIVSMTPNDGSVNNDLNLNKVVIEFNKNLNSATVTQDAIKILSYPVSGTYDGSGNTRSNRERKLYKIISVTDNKITLEF